jgi:propanol-preferring alcohol dehydrogenase
MRAMLLESPAAAEQSPLHPVELEAPAPGAGEVRVRVLCCGLCHTDLHIVEGELPLPKLPVVPGHQIVGIVDAVGSGVQRLREGDRVGIPWLYSTCGKCRYCLSGLENLCEQARFTGYSVNGGYAEAAVVQEDFCYALPATFSDEHAAPLLCAGIIGYRSFRLSRAKAGDWLGLYGFGASAHIVVQFARYRGIQVAVFTRTAAHAELALKLGAAWVGDARQQPPSPLDAAIIFAPAGGLVPEALRATRPGGTVACAGIAMSAIPQMNYSLLYRERVLRSVANSTRQDAREFLELAAEVPVHTTVQVFALDEANRALQLLKHSRIEGAGVLSIGSNE